MRDDAAGKYIPIVPLAAEPSTEFEPVADLFRVLRPAITLRIPLFRGAGPMDHSLMPMQDLVLQLPRVVSAGVPYSLSYRITEDKTVQLRAKFRPDAGTGFEVDSELDIQQDVRDANAAPIPLAHVN